jgi:hypothetical protein
LSHGAFAVLSMVCRQRLLLLDLERAHTEVKELSTRLET